MSAEAFVKVETLSVAKDIIPPPTPKTHTHTHTNTRTYTRSSSVAATQMASVVR